MGRGDKKTKKGKIAMGSYGVSRPRPKAASKTATPKAGSTAKTETTKKAAAKKDAPAKKAPKKTTKKEE